ncbi:hypothetical protein RQP50_14460 [Paenibacillus sp. chi10]|uniref:Uncharacterized protein n=1 Tax=Paenibacillus suaedae TaxID=3077233 RepID=A0AAJ2JZT9_9BACL|nr:hypothetical protein [Paenibacillus sp. chi10]MDT8977437.1 hypothetical protein [Paenibacillus sp. chi10]
MTKLRHQSTTGKVTKPRRVSGWFIFFLLTDLLVFGGFAIMYSESNGWEKGLQNAVPVETVTPEMTGIVAITGTLTSRNPALDEHLASSYALLVKEDRRWSCNSRNCSYVTTMTTTVGNVNGLSVNGIPLQPSVFRLTDLTVPLHEGTLRNPNEEVENNRVLVVAPKETALSYGGVPNGEEVTILGQAEEGQLKPMSFPNGTDSVLYGGLPPYAPKDKPETIERGYVVGSSLDAIIAHEKNMQNDVIWTVLIVGLLLLPVTLLLAPWPKKQRG